MKFQSSKSHVGHRHSSTAVALALASASVLLILSLQTQIQISYAFSTSNMLTNADRTRHSRQSLLPLNSEVQTPTFVDASAEDDNDAAKGLPELTGALAGSRLHEFELKEHKPLGCSVEESLANEPDEAKYVFVAEVTKGGNAEKAGIRAGDVIVQLSGTFYDVVDVAGLGIEKIRSLVGGRPDDDPLVIRVSRGSDVMERHELALVELCIIGDEAETAECITSIYADDDMDIAGDSEMAICDEDDGTECMLDSIWSDWSDGLESTDAEKEVEEVKEEKKKVAQPWASRSSGSGTYVRNPKTGKMENIDE
ncbi:hypothetical protein ACHAXR_008116 [Thalassiosira sp. AJA248-18]